MSWEIKYLPEAQKDLNSLDNSQQLVTMAAIQKVQTNPLPQHEGGYGKPLGNKHGKNLTGLLKIKLKKEGIRVVYKLMRSETQMLIIVIGVRSDDEVYDLAYTRKTNNNL